MCNKEKSEPTTVQPEQNSILLRVFGLFDRGMTVVFVTLTSII